MPGTRSRERNVQSTSPEMRACSMPSTEKRRMSLFVSEETFHQKLTVTGPVTVVCMELEALLPKAPLRAASAPSWVTAVWPTHPDVPLVAQGRLVASSASARDTKVATVSNALALATPRVMLDTT